MIFEKTGIKDVYIVKLSPYSDHRGTYLKLYEKAEFAKAGIEFSTTEHSIIFSKQNAFRGIHYQRGESQGKLIKVISGVIFDVVVDLRFDSPTFGKTLTFVLNDDDDFCVFLPKGVGHGFLSLKDNTVFDYICYGKYEPELCGTLKFDDSDLKIDWPINKNDLILSEKDKNGISLKEYIELYGRDK